MFSADDRKFDTDAIRSGSPLNLSWFVRLRWAAISVHLAAVGLTHPICGIDIRWPALLGIIGCEAASNVIVSRLLSRLESGRERGERWLGIIMAVDLLFLTALLYFSGGPTNPFSVFYIINIALAAAALPSRWAWTLTAVAVCCFASLFRWHVPVAALAHADHGGQQHEAVGGHVHGGASSDVTSSSMDLHLRGMLFAFAGASGFVAYFVTRVRRELDQRDQALAEARRRQAVAEKLESLVTLAAGAAHELATPLSTVMVAACEIEHELDGRTEFQEMLRDVQVIRRETSRCRHILDSLTTQAGERMGESWGPVRLGELLDDARALVKPPTLVRLEVTDASRRLSMLAPYRALVQSFQNLIQNGIDASDGVSPVVVRTEVDGGAVSVNIIDVGRGMSEATTRRIGEPFFTTRGPGHGMGLGVFLAKRVVEQLGGRIEFISQIGHGTTAQVTLPASTTPDSGEAT